MSFQKQNQSDDGDEDRSCCFQDELNRTRLYGNITDHMAETCILCDGSISLWLAKLLMFIS